MSCQIRFDNGAAYEQYMGKWSQRVGETFLEWLTPADQLRWLDVGCGNGAFTEQICARTSPASATGIDPAEGMLEFARQRPALRDAVFRQGDAMALPFGNSSFDIAVMPLVIFFVPEPARGVAEMARVLRRGGTAAAYAWDMDGGGFPYHLLHSELSDLGAAVPSAPSPEASRLDRLHDLWKGAGLENIEVREIRVQRSFDSMQEYWETILGGPSIGALLASLSASDVARLMDRLRVLMPADDQGRIHCEARANAIRGSVPS